MKMKFRFISKSKTRRQKLRFGAGLVQHRASLWCWVSQLPKSPGVYAFKRGKEFLYIGKASDIKERVKNHFQQPSYRDGLFISELPKVGYLKTDSEIEALILEANLIKKYQPKYNVMWRDDKNYFYVGVTKELFPRIFITHQIKLKQSTINPENASLSLGDGAGPVRNKRFLNGAGNQQITINYTGPFVDGKSLKTALKILRKVFPYRSCKTLPKRPCLWHQLGRCPAPCQLKSKNYGSRISIIFKNKMRNECQRNTKNLLKILQGKKNQVLKDLKKEMKKASVSQNFERAAKIRDQILALEKVLAHSKIFEPTKIIESYFDYLKTEKILKNLLKTKRKIRRIEAYDVSNIQGKAATGSMVTFINGKPDKNFYRRFKIKSKKTPDDIAMLKEILTRRFKHSEWPLPDVILIDGGKAQLNAAQSIISPLFAHYSHTAHSNYQLTIPIIALAKKKNELYFENYEPLPAASYGVSRCERDKVFLRFHPRPKGRGIPAPKNKKPIRLDSLPNSLKFVILRLRDEAHRFARKYHHKLRQIDLRESI